MSQTYAAVEFPVVVSKGEHHIKIGTIDIDPSLDFQKFKTILEQMIGVSYNNLTTYLVDNKEYQMILVTSNNQNGVEGVKDVSNDSGDLCVYDDVVEGFFRTVVGPVSRQR
ncbi:hypothetical protein HanIR_Chr13g0635211 [Helianthus annuus]|nr:hypothetical protein HanIR_Chr13g0635211 [Helianthus annuus]